jgi:hypothetical protein
MNSLNEISSEIYDRDLSFETAMCSFSRGSQDFCGTTLHIDDAILVV